METAIKRAAMGIFAGIIVGVLSLLAALGAAGGGHGVYMPAAILFPYTMLSTRPLGSITTAFAVLALLQFPLYGGVIGWIGHRVGRWKVVGAILILHTLVAFAAIHGRDARFYP